MIDPETEHLIARAKKQAVLAIQAEHPAAARAHQTLARRYSARAVIGLMGEKESDDQTRPTFPAVPPTGH